MGGQENEKRSLNQISLYECAGALRDVFKDRGFEQGKYPAHVSLVLDGYQQDKLEGAHYEGYSVADSCSITMEGMRWLMRNPRFE